MIIQNNAIFVADAHYNGKRIDLYKLLLLLQNETLISEQIFFMGDIFDFLSEEITYFLSINKKIISLINKLSNNHEIIYLEGNHDFNLHNLFPNINIIKRERQPFIIKQDSLNIALAHGDIFTPFSYNLYSLCIRNHYFLKFINFLDINHCISKVVEEKLMNKNICHKQNNFMQFIHNRIKSYNSLSNIDLIIEGHFHQGHIGEHYINVPSLACGNKYMTYKNNQFSFNTL